MLWYVFVALLYRAKAHAGGAQPAGQAKLWASVALALVPPATELVGFLRAWTP
jgi:hypothetical protein